MGLEIIAKDSDSIDFSRMDHKEKMFISISVDNYINMVYLDKNDLELIYNHLKIALNK